MGSYTMDTGQEAMDGSPSTVPLSFPGSPLEDGAGYIKFQAGSIQEFGRNGTTIEAVIQVLINRLEGFQRGPFACNENAAALANLRLAKQWLEMRTKNRQGQGVEGKNLPHIS